MPATKNGGGDALARGAIRAKFGPAERKLTDKQFEAMFEGFDAEKFVKNEAPKVSGTKETTRQSR